MELVRLLYSLEQKILRTKPIKTDSFLMSLHTTFTNMAVIIQSQSVMIYQFCIWTMTFNLMVDKNFIQVVDLN